MTPLPEHLLACPVEGLVPFDDARAPLRAIIASLALGGAERIVLEWAADAFKRGRRVELAVLQRAQMEWPVPQGLVLLRRGEAGMPADMHAFITGLAGRWGGGAVAAAHLLRDGVLAALRAQGLLPVPVLHNARAGWMNDPAAWASMGIPAAVACAQAVARQAREAGCALPLPVIRHRPAVDGAAFSMQSRREIRRKLGVGERTLLVGMIGALKPQKNYPRALRVLRALLKTRDAALAIAGGIFGESGMEVLRDIAAYAGEQGIARQVKLPGFVTPVAPWLAAFDVLLNTSDYEGYSIATQEALAAGLPVVGTAVSGQVEDPQPGLTLLPAQASETEFARELAGFPVRGELREPQGRMRAPSLWSLPLAACAPPAGEPVRSLFVTANLNAGGAQRSLVNLLGQINGSESLALAVCSESTQDYFAARLRDAGVRHFRPADTRDAVEMAEALLAWVARHDVRQLAFWNADPKLKLLIAKFAAPALRLVDVSPGQYAFEEMAATGEFQEVIAYSEAAFHARLDVLVLKYGESVAGHGRHCEVIPNGVADAVPAVRSAAPRFLVSGRIAPSKHLEEILAAFAQVRSRHAQASLHIAGQAEPRHAAYLAQLLETAGEGVTFRGALPDLAFLGEPEGWTAQIVIGTHQGSPNAVLEAMAAGVPVIANDSGGTCELVNAATGWLLPEAATDEEIARAMLEVIARPEEASRRAENARVQLEKFSLPAMAARYLAVLGAGGTIPA
jgi:glycosyltransferase involved in cell wall biosynthesis